MVHGLLARFDPVYNLDGQEAGALAEAWAGYLKHTSISDTVDPKTRALFALVSVTLAIEGPRTMRVMAARKAQRQQDKAAADAAARAGGRVVQMPGINGV